MNDMPVACQSRAVTEPQEMRVVEDADPYERNCIQHFKRKENTS